MKNKTSVLAVIGMVAMLMVSNLVNAQITPPTDGGGGGGGGTSLSAPKQLPIGSVAELEAAFWERVGNISMYSYASSAIRSTTNDQTSVYLDYTPTNGVVDVEEIFSIIRVQKLVLNVLYPSDKVTLGVNLQDREGYPLFYSYSSARINPPKEGLSFNVLDVLLEMDGSAWLTFCNVSWFYIVERDQFNNPVRYYSPPEYGVQGCRLLFPAYFAGKHGEMVVSLKDGTQVAYSLDRGFRMPTIPVLLGVGKVSAVGTRTIHGNLDGPYDKAYLEIQGDEVRKNINPLTQFVKPKDGLVYLAAWVRDPDTREIREYASSVFVWFQGKSSSSATEVKIPPSQPYVAMNLPTSRYWIRYEFPTYARGVNQFYPPYDGGGKGGAVVSTPVSGSGGGLGRAEEIPAAVAPIEN